MNKRCYRIVFNRARRMLVVVSELARSRGGDTGRGPGAAAICAASLRPLTLALWLAGGLVSAAQADTIAADRSAPGGQRATVLQTGNGLPQVNIQTPNGSGLSHNKFSQFDVGERGAILNNSRSGAQTQLAGQVAGNPWLAKGAAKVILNEVNGATPSQLRGFVEVAGSRADVIIANPAGITCSGCGFINAGRSTLAAGRPRLENGQVAGYDVDRGKISISGSGMNGTGQDYTRLIARAVEVNGRLQAGDLKITTGRNQTDADGNVIQVKADDPDGRPQFAVDTAALGGMYANRITLVGTERGVGVRNAGEIGATQGGFTLSADGKLTNSGTVYGQQDLALKTAQLDNRGTISSGGSLKIDNQGDLTNGGRLSADADLQLDASGRLRAEAGSALVAGGNAAVSARSIEADGGSAMGAGIDSDGRATRSGRLTLSAADRLASHGTHLSRDGITISGREADLSGSRSRAADVTVTAREGDLNADRATIDAPQATLSAARRFTAREGAIAADRLTASAGENINNRGGALISRGAGDFTLSGREIDNSGGTLASAGNFALRADRLINTGGQLGSDRGSVSLQSGDISGAGGKIIAAKDLTVSGGNMVLDDGLVQGQQIDLRGASLSLDGGHLLQTGAGEAKLAADGLLSSRGGLLESAGSMTLSAGSLDNAQGRIASGGALQVGSGALDNTSGALVGQDLQIDAAGVTNRKGTLQGRESLIVNAGSLDSRDGFISADGGDARLAVTGDIDNRGGNLQSAKNLTLSGRGLDNSGGRLLAADGQLRAQLGGQVNNAGGKLIAQALDLRGAGLNNSQGAISAVSGDGKLTLSGAADNGGGTLEAAAGLSLSAASLDNTAGRIATPGALDLDLRGGQLINARTDSSGLGILSGQALTLRGGDVNNQNGTLQARSLDLRIGAVDNRAGYLGASDALTLTGTSLDNAGGLLSADGGDASLTLGGALDNQGGTLQSLGDLALSAGSLNNDGGKALAAKGRIDGTFDAAMSNRAGSVLAGTALDLSAGSVDNQKGLIAATGGEGRIAAAGALDNRGGDIESRGALALEAGSLDNGGGQILTNDDMRLAAGGLSNAAGLIQARNALDIDTRGGALNNADTLRDAAGIRAGGALTLSAGDVDNHSGLISGETIAAGGRAWNNRGGELDSAGALSLNGTSLDNGKGLVSAGSGDLTAAFSGTLDNRDGTLQSSKNLNVDAGALNNDGGALLAAGGAADLKVRDDFSNQQGRLLAKGDLQLTAGRADNQQGQISSLGGAAALSAAGGIVNQRGTIDAAGALRLSGGDIDNREGQLVASGGALTASGGAVNNRGGRMAAQGDLQIDGRSLDNGDGTITSVDGALTARLAEAIDNQGGILQSGRSVSIDGGSLDNRAGKVLAVAGDTHIAARDALLNAAGQIVGSGNIDLSAGRLDNAGGTVSSQRGALDVTVDDALGNAGGALEADGPLQIAADSLDNSGGSLLSASDSLTAEVAQGLNNDGGRIAARRAVTLSAGELTNRQGSATAVDDGLTLAVGGSLDNSGGTLQSSGALTLGAAGLINRDGTVQSTKGDSRITTGGSVDNQRGTVSAGNSLTLNSGDVDNSGGGALLAKTVDLTSRALNNRAGLIQGSESLAIDTQGQRLDNSNTDADNTGLRSGGALTLAAGDVDNRAGLIAGRDLTLSGQSVDNRAGTIASAGNSDITTGALNNAGGTLQAGGSARIDTGGAGLDNASGKLLADGGLDIRAGSLDNGQGLIQGGAGLTLAGGALDNQQGRILSGADLTAEVTQLNNGKGLLFADGDATLSASEGVQNTQGLIKAGQALTITAPQLDNSDSRADGQGIEAQTLTVNADDLNNRGGALRAGDALLANVGGRIDNRGGLISSQNGLTLGQDDRRPTLANGGGDIIANGDAGLRLGQIDGVGRIVSGGSLSLDVASDLAQDGTLAAGKDLTLSAGGTVTNSGSITAADRLTLGSARLDNRQSGEINAGTTRITADDILNQGLIDGGDVLLRAGSLHNTGSGRLYGDDLKIDARTLTNDRSGDSAATIAARDHLTIGTDHLINQDRGLIYSDGDLRIGGSIGDDGALTGQAAMVENLSSSVEAMGNLRIDAGQTENRDIHLTVSPEMTVVSQGEDVLEVELCSGEEWPEGCGRINGEHYRFSGKLLGFSQGNTSNVAFDFDSDGRSYALDEQGNRVTVSVDGKQEPIYLWRDAQNDIIWFNLPGVTGSGRRFDVFSFKQSVKEQQVSGQDSAVMRSGGDLQLNGSLHNKDSQVVAGQDLIINGSVNNEDTTVRQEITRDGVVVRAGKRKEHKQTHFEGQGVYQPPVQETDLPLHLTVQQQGQGAADGRSIDGQKPTGGAGGEASGLGAGAELAQRGDRTLISEVALPPGQSVDTQLTAAGGGLSDGAGGTAADLQTRPGAAGGLTEVALTGAGGLTASADGSTAVTQTGGGLDEAQSGSRTVPPGQDNWVLRSVSGPVTLPQSSLFVLHPGTDSQYLVETDPQFTRGRAALGSGDFYSQDRLQKRLGDGYYEQALVRDQILKATGQRYLSGYSSDEDQYRDLLQSGKSFSERFNIAPGAELSAEQMAQVTRDMVLMVDQTVTLPDGSRQVVSVPKLYARVHPGDLQGSGALLSGNRVRITTAGDVINSGTIQGRDLTSVSAGNLLNSGDIGGRVTQLAATNDIVNRGGQLSGSDALTLQAGHDILSLTEGEQRGSERWLGRQAGMSVTGDKGELSLSAGHDIQLTASAIGNQGRESQTRLVAGNDITLDTAGVSHATDYTQSRKNYDRSLETREVGTTIGAGGDLLMQAGRDINLRAADVTASGDAALLAGNDVNLLSGEDTWDQSSNAKWKKRHGLSKTKTELHSESHQRTAASSTVSGDAVTVMAGNNLTAEGSNILGTRDVTLGAGNDLTLTTADESDHSISIKKKKKSGFSGTGGIGFSVGSSSQKLTTDDTSNVRKGSVVGSSEGNLNLLAGNAATVHGSDLVAGQDLTVQGKTVDITAAENSHTALSKSESKSSGLTLALSGTVGSALNTAAQQVKGAKKEEDGRLAALKGTQAALTGYQATQAARLAAVSDKPEDGNFAGVTLSYGKQSSHSESRLDERTASGSSLQAGRDLNVRATDGDLNVQGARLQAGRDMGLAAARDINMTSGQNSSQSSGSNKSHGGSVGVGLAVGSGSAGISISASANQSKGRENGSSLSHVETTADTGRSLTLSSGRDALLQGAQVSGESIKADVGRNLSIVSEQDSDRYDMKQHSASAGASVTFGVGASGSGSVSVSRDKMHSNFDSVQEQSGLFAGKGGFDVTVGNHTQLDGGVIASTAPAERNRLDTGTLGWSDIHNRADFKTEHQSAGISSGGSVAGQFLGNMASNLAVAANGSGHDSSTTHAAVEAGTITVRDGANQQQDVGTLSRDTEHAANGLSPIFDKEKEQRRLQEAQLIGEIGTQVVDIARTEGKIAGTKARKDPAALAKAKAELAAEAAKKGQVFSGDSEAIAQRAYDNAMQSWGTGSAIQQGIQAATAAVQGLAGGDLAAAVAGGAAPYLAEVIHRQTTDPVTGEVNKAANLMAHAVLGAAVALAQDHNALAGAAGGASGEAAGMIAQSLYGKKASELTEDEKQRVSALGTLAAGLAGGLAGGDTESAVAGEQAGRNAVENNFLNSKDVFNLHKELEEADKTGADKQRIYEKYAGISKKNRDEAVAKECSGNPFCANGAFQEAQGGSDIANSLNHLPAFSSLSSEDLAQLDRFVLAENEESARAIYQAMPDYVKVALNGKEAVEALGLGAAIGGKSLAALGIVGKAKKDNQNHEFSGDPAFKNGYVFKQGVDLDLRGKQIPTKTAVQEAFTRTGVNSNEFTVTKWGLDKNGKSIPVEYRVLTGKNKGAEVSIDLGHEKNGPGVPHVGFQTPGKNNVVGHIFLDDVSVNRPAR